jgi:hypothetical protein
MIGVNPPGHFLWKPEKIDEQLEYYSRLYSSDSTIKDSALSLTQTMKNVLSRMPARWSFFTLDPGKIKVMTFVLLYHKQTAAMVFDSYFAADEGDYSGLYLMQLAYDFVVPSLLTWGDLFAKGASADFDPARDYVAELSGSNTTIGSPLALLIWGSAGGKWQTQMIPAELRKVQRSDVETLLISGNIDFSSPAEYATNELLPFLPKGKQIILKEMGHVDDLMGLQRAALVHLLSRFYDDGIVDDSKFKYDPMNFKPSVSFPFLAKVFYPVILVLKMLGF